METVNTGAGATTNGTADAAASTATVPATKAASTGSSRRASKSAPKKGANKATKAPNKPAATVPANSTVILDDPNAKVNTVAPVPDVNDVAKDSAKSTAPVSNANAVKDTTDSPKRGDVINAHKAGDPKQKRTFSRITWNLLGPNKEGWVEDIKVPKEVQELEAKKQAGK